jgi:predicted Zn-dependent protease
MKSLPILIGMALAVAPSALPAPLAVMQSATPPQSSAPTFADAQALAANGKLTEALALLDALAAVQPEESGVERLRGQILYQKEHLPEAEAAFASAVAQDPSDRESEQMEGVTIYRLGRPADAIPLLEKANLASNAPSSTTAANPGANADPQYVLGLCYTDTKRYDDARHAFALQFGFPPDSAEAYLVAARLFLRREFADEAAIFAKKAVELNPALPLAHQLLGEIALAKADLPTAVSELEAERKLNPLDGPMYDRLGDAYIRNGQYEDARQALNKAVLLEPSSTGPYILLGEALVKLGDPIQALHYLNRAATMDPGNYVTHTILGQAYRALGQTAEANREYKLAVEIQHRNDPKPVQAR